jgi:hypothetical protein
MADHSDPESNNSYSYDVEFDKKVSEILLSFSDGGPRLRGHGEGTFVCPFCCGKKVPSWTLRELLQHENGKSLRGEGISGLVNTNLTQLERVKSELKRINGGGKTMNGKTVNMPSSTLGLEELWSAMVEPRRREAK